jgi:hypothetical protein
LLLALCVLRQLNTTTQGHLSKFGADIGVINEKVASVVPLSDAVQAQVHAPPFALQFRVQFALSSVCPRVSN